MANSVSASTIRDAALATSDEWTASALEFLQTLEANALAEISVDLPVVATDIPNPDYESTVLARVGSEPIRSAGSNFVSPSSDPGGFSSEVTLTAPELVQIPDYTAATPDVDLPARPELATPTAPAAPLIEDIATPVAPTIVLPTAPTISAVAFPVAPTLSLPTFTEAAPDTPASFIQTVTFEYQDDVHETPLLDAIEAKLQTDVEDGGYGIESDDEAALWDRARDRNMRELDGVETETAARYSARGYSMPPGAMLAALNQARSEAETKLAESEREIMVQRAALFRDNRKFAMEHGTTLENVRWQHFGFAMERALNAQRFTAEYAIAVHDAYVRQFNTELQRYTALASVFQTRLQAALTQIQIYETELRAAIAQQEANKIDVEIYEALLSAVTSQVQLFEAQTRAASLAADLQRLKVDTYRAEVQAFATRVDANQSQLGVYEAGIRGELAKLDIFRTEVGAYGDRVRAAGIEQGARNERAQVLISQRGAELEGYRAEIARHQLNVSAETARVSSLLQAHGADVQQYGAAISGYESLARLNLSGNDAEVRAIQEQTKRLQVNAQLETDQIKASLEENFKAANSGANLASNIVTAVNNTFQALAIEQQTEST